jgi:hypothetical protein
MSIGGVAVAGAGDTCCQGSQVKRVHSYSDTTDALRMRGNDISIAIATVFFPSHGRRRALPGEGGGLARVCPIGPKHPSSIVSSEVVATGPRIFAVCQRHTENGMP